MTGNYVNYPMLRFAGFVFGIPILLLGFYLLTRVFEAQTWPWTTGVVSRSDVGTQRLFLIGKLLLPLEESPMLIHSRMRRLALWWSAVNAVGVLLSIAIEEHIAYQKYRLPADRHAPYLVVWLAFLIALGVLQALACCWLISFMKIRNKIFQVTLGLAQGILTAIIIPVLGVFFVVYVFPFPGYLDEYHYGAEALIGIYPFLFSGIIFGLTSGYFQSPSSTRLTTSLGPPKR